MEQTIGQRIAEQRKKIGLTQNELAEKLMVSNKAVSKWESDNGNPSIEFLPNLSKILNCSIDYLLTGQNFYNENLKIPISFDFQSKNHCLEDLTKLLNTNIYCNNEENRDNIFNFLVEEINKNTNSSLVKVYVIENSQKGTDVKEKLESLHKNLFTRQPIIAPIGEWSKPDNDYIFPATPEKPFIVILIKEINDFLIIKEYEGLLRGLLELGKAMGIYIIAVNASKIFDQYKDKFKTIIKYEVNGSSNNKIYIPRLIENKINNSEDSLEDSIYQNFNFPINFGYIKNKIVYFEVEKLLGTLITGQEGSGKSNLLNYIITQIVSEYRSDKVQIALIDSKDNNFKYYEKDKYLFSNIAHTQTEIHDLLKRCYEELESRNNYLGKLQITIRDKIEERKNFPYLVIFIDEILDVIQNKENLKYIQLILQLGRACGIFMFIATKSIKEKEIPDCITLNISTRISFRLPNKEISKFYLGEEGAEKLSKKGEAIIKTRSDKSELILVPYYSESILKALSEDRNLDFYIVKKEDI